MKVVMKKTEAKEPFSWTFQKDGKTIVRSENYKEKRSAVNGIESVKKNCANEGRYELKESSNGKFFFNLKAANGQIIGTSPMFASPADRQAAIDALKAGAASAGVEEA
ncbi:MAG TPA: DUF1508 domain-containing protein [Gammaproteobacteria bacterium]|nr:DUF1508 domain-containing protein [Gammaproteobacteria bacterium]